MLILILATAIADSISLGAFLPLIGVLTNPQKVLEASYARPIFDILNISTASQVIIPVCIFFIGLILIAGAVRILYLYASIRFASAVGADIGITIYRKTLYQPYTTHIKRNSSEVISGITQKTDATVHQVLLPILSLLSSILILLALLVTMFYIDLVLALISFSAFGILYVLVAYYSRKRLVAFGELANQQRTLQLKAIQEGLGGIRDVLVDGTQNFYTEIFRVSDRAYRHAQAGIQFLGFSPRYLLEIIAMVLLVCIAYYVNLRPGGLMAAVPLLGALGLAAQRLLPVLQTGYGAWATLKSAHPALQDVLVLLDQQIPEHLLHYSNHKLSFQSSIQISNMSFTYEKGTPFVLRDINFTIKKGERIAFMGETGSGKSTLADILMGLLLPQEGGLTIDGRPLTVEKLQAWQQNIAHVPQSIYLADTNIAENIAFGINREQIDQTRLYDAAKQARIHDFIMELPNGYGTFVGERGVRLSGGQRQRIGIARALYKDSSVIFFDEATSALDSQTEVEVMEAINNLKPGLTLIIIAHRLNTIQNCDQIIELSVGRLKRKGTYQELFNPA